MPMHLSVDTTSYKEFKVADTLWYSYILYPRTKESN